MALAVAAGCLLSACARERPDPPAPQVHPARASGLPHAVVVDGGEGHRIHLHVAALLDVGVLTSGFGRRGALGGGRGHHDGLDISAPAGTPVRAAAGGRVVEVGRFGAYGRRIRIRHSAEIETVYAHLSGYHKDLAVGSEVRQADVIGYVGTSGNASGPHLHFELRRRGRPVDALALPPQAEGN